MLCVGAILIQHLLVGDGKVVMILTETMRSKDIGSSSNNHNHSVVEAFL